MDTGHHDDHRQHTQSVRLRLTAAGMHAALGPAGWYITWWSGAPQPRSGAQGWVSPLEPHATIEAAIAEYESIYGRIVGLLASPYRPMT